VDRADVHCVVSSSLASVSAEARATSRVVAWVLANFRGHRLQGLSFFRTPQLRVLSGTSLQRNLVAVAISLSR
jgi:hypothetical protein